jgi:hypothetical protein
MTGAMEMKTMKRRYHRRDGDEENIDMPKKCYCSMITNRNLQIHYIIIYVFGNRSADKEIKR